MVAIDWPVTEIVGTGPGLPCLAGNTYDPARCDLDACAARCALKSCYGKRECNSRDCRAGISERCRAELVERARESSAKAVGSLARAFGVEVSRLMANTPADHGD